MKHTFVTTIRKQQEEAGRIRDRAKKLSWTAGGIVGAGSAALLLAAVHLLENEPRTLEAGEYIAAALMGIIFGAFALLVTRTIYQDEKLQQLVHRFQADVRAHAEGQYGLAVQHGLIHPDHTERLGYATRGENVVPVKVSFPDSDSFLQVKKMDGSYWIAPNSMV